MRILSIHILSGLSLAAACHGAAAAEWTQLPTAASSGVAVYTDPATEHTRHNQLVGLFVRNPVRAWFVTDYASPHRWMVHDVLSAKHLVEFDCRRASMRMLARLYYDGPMTQGRLVASETESPGFTPVVPGHAEEAMYQSACARDQAQTHSSAPSADPQAEY